jgi:tetratricopeptide (TPR) repeat protein
MAFPQVTDAGPGRCEGGDAAWAQAWNSQGRARIEASLQQLGGTLSQQTWTRVQESLARYGDQWKRSYRDACEATDRDAAERDRTMACLHAARTSVSALSEGLAEADRRVLVRAVEAAHALPDPASCLDAPVVGEPRAVGPQAESLALELAWVEASVEAGVFPDEAIDRVERRARSVGDPRLLARTLLLRGRALADAGDEAAALERLEQAQYTAEAAGDDRTLLRAVTELIYLRGHVRRQPEAALGLEGLARATLARMGDPDDTRGRLLNAIGNALEAQKKFEDAQAVYTEALEVLSRAHGREGADVARTLNNLGNAALRQGKPDEARAFYERARSTWSDALGADHPNAVMPMANLAVIQLRQGQLSEGREALRVVLGSWEQAYGLTHRKLLMPLQNLAIVSRNLQDFEAALDYDRRNVEVATAVYGPDHEHVARALQGMATTLRHLERFDEAADRARQAAAIYEMVLGPDHPDLSFVYTELAKTQVHLPEADKAVEYARRAQQIDAAHFGSDSPENGPNEYTLAHVLNELGRFAEAEPVARAAIASYADSELDPENLAASHWELAKALRGQGKAASPVQAQATQAIEIYRAAEHETEATQVEAWLAAG